MKKHELYNVGIYCRLSKDDVGGGDSSSIISQRSLLENYVRDNGWGVAGCYADDGYSGTNFNRPGFKRMIDDIEDGKINMVVCKDLSRLGRNYILTGQYTDIYFPDRGVRFVAINDGIDSKNTDNDIAPFRNILNELYSKDISKKIRSVVRVKKQKGEFLSNYAPYGYRKDPANRNKLIIDEQPASVVRRIFTVCAEGHGCKYIANQLNQEGILSPLNQRKRMLNRDVDYTNNRWNAETIITILRNRIYTGDMVQGIYECAQFKRTPSKRKPKEEWIITPNTHEAIVDDALWEQAQASISSRRRVTRTGELQLFAGFVKCQDCGHALSYAFCQGIPQYTCGYYRRFGREACSCHYIRKDTLTQVVLDDIRTHARLAATDVESMSEQLLTISGDNESQKIHNLNTELNSAKARLAELDMIIKRLFESYVTGVITESRFQKLNAEYEAEQAGLEKRVEVIENEIADVRQNVRDTSSWLEIIKEYTDLYTLDRIVLSELIDKITVGEARMVNGVKVTDITIYYRFVGAIGQMTV